MSIPPLNNLDLNNLEFITPETNKYFDHLVEHTFVIRYLDAENKTVFFHPTPGVDAFGIFSIRNGRNSTVADEEGLLKALAEILRNRGKLATKLILLC